MLGSGRTEILRIRFSAQRAAGGAAESQSTAQLVVINSPTDACTLGIALVTEDRKARGLLLASTVRDNVALPSVGPLSRFGLRDFAREAALAADVVERLSVRCNDADQIVSTLSGGNQQKVVIGKWLATEPAVLLLDEPTRGIDVGAKQEIYELVFELAARGTRHRHRQLGNAGAVAAVRQGSGDVRRAPDWDSRRRAEATQETIMRLAAPGLGERAAGAAG